MANTIMECIINSDKERIVRTIDPFIFRWTAFLTRNLNQPTGYFHWGALMALHKTFCNVDQEYMHVFFFSISTKFGSTK